MSKLLKEIKGILNSQTNVKFGTLDKILVHFGYMSNKPSGSHYTYRKEGEPFILTIPKHNPIKKIYVEKVQGNIGLFRLKNYPAVCHTARQKRKLLNQ